jgi:hypothetical protein
MTQGPKWDLDARLDEALELRGQVLERTSRIEML